MSEGSSSRTVLIADDDEQSRVLVRAALAHEGFQLFEARDGREAWELLNERRPAVAILDIDMPGQSGLQLTHAIEQTPDLIGTRVILLTANTDDTRAGFEAGASLYLTKPFSPVELRLAVHRIWVGA